MHFELWIFQKPSGVEGVMNYAEKIMNMLPRGIRLECERASKFRLDYPQGLNEIRLRAGGRSALVLSGENVPLCYTVTKDELSEILASLSGGSLYAYRDTIRKGYIPMEGGGRVGICGHARYDGDKCIGISEISSLAIRIPHSVRLFAENIAGLFSQYGGGVLIYSPPSCGKTTALRSLAGLLGSGSAAMRVVVVDERCEFNFSDYSSAQVDILRGYRKGDGVEIALRTMAPEVIIIDEIGSERETEALLSTARCGVSLIASAHAASISDVLARPPLMSLVRCGIFRCFFKISRGADGAFEVTREEPECLNI